MFISEYLRTKLLVLLLLLSVLHWSHHVQSKATFEC
jgi:hypothetical protein